MNRGLIMETELIRKSTKIKEIVGRHNNVISAVKEILNKGLAISSSEAKRYFYLLKDSTKEFIYT